MHALAIGQGGHVFASDYGLGRIQEFTAVGGFVIRWGTQGQAPASLTIRSESRLTGLALSS